MICIENMLLKKKKICIKILNLCAYKCSHFKILRNCRYPRHHLRAQNQSRRHQCLLLME